MTIRRLKTYTGAQGFVYQYYSIGQRRTPANDAIEYIFDVSPDRRTTYPIGILLPDAALKTWAETHGRLLSSAEQYAVAKLRLFRVFDELEQPSANEREFLVDSDDLQTSLATLGIDG